MLRLCCVSVSLAFRRRFVPRLLRYPFVFRSTFRYAFVLRLCCVVPFTMRNVRFETCIVCFTTCTAPFETCFVCFATCTVRFKRVLSASQRALYVLKRVLSASQRALYVLKRVLSASQRAPYVLKRVLSVSCSYNVRSPYVSIHSRAQRKTHASFCFPKVLKNVHGKRTRVTRYYIVTIIKFTRVRSSQILSFVALSPVHQLL